MRRLLPALLCLWLLPGEARAVFRKSDAGTATGQFLKLGADARAASMGQAVRAFSEDANAVYWNPAGLASLRYRHATMTHSAYYQSLFYDFISYAQPVQSILGRSSRELQESQLGSFGVSLLYLNGGTLNEVDNTGVETGGNFRPQDFAASIAWGGSMTRILDFGVALKYISSHLHESASTGAVDLGARLRWRLIDMPWTLAATVHNAGGHMKFISQSDPLPLQLAVSQSLRVTKNWTVTTDVVAPSDNRPYPCFGSEIRMPMEPNMSVMLRAGYEARTGGEFSGLSGLGLGGGLGLARFGFDYAWMPYGLLGDTHRLSISYRF